MAQSIFEPTFTREAAELGRRLALGRGHLLRDGKSGDWSLWSGKNGFSRPVGRAADTLVSEMEARGYLKARPGGGLMPAQASRSKAAVDVTAPDGHVVSTDLNETECALDWLRGRKNQSGEPLIADELFSAAERLRRDYTLARMEQRVTANWDAAITPEIRRAGARPDAPVSETALAAKDRVFAALKQVGPELSGILLEVCCMASGLEHAERLLGLPRRSGRAVLQLALTRLARHYGLLPEETPRLAQGRLRHWAAPDYRPRMG